MGFELWNVVATNVIPTGTRTANLACLAYGRGGGYDAAAYATIANQFDVCVGSETNISASSIVAYNPNIIMLHYTNTSNATSGVGLATGLVDADYQLVTSATATQHINADSFNHVIGDKICSYGAPFNYDGATTRWRTNYFNSTARQKIIDWHKNNLPTGWTGWFDDNMDTGGGFAGDLDSGTCDGGFDASGGSIALSSDNLAEGHCNDMKVQIDSSFSADMLYCCNTSNYGVNQFTTTNANDYWWQIGDDQVNGQTASRAYPDGFKFSRGNFMEFMFTFTATYANIQGNYYGMEEIWTLKGSPSNNMHIMWWTNTGGGIVANNDDRVKMFALGCHLHNQFDACYMRYAGINNASPETGDWFGAMGVALGTPTGVTAMDARTYRREYTGGVVIVRYRTASGDNYTDTANYSLGGTFTTVNADGTTGASVTNVNLRNAEAFIGIL